MKNTKRIWFGLGIVVAAILAIIIVNYVSNNNPTPSIIKVGFIAPLSGNQAFIGQDFKEGLALRVPNNVVLVFEDSQGDVAKAVTAYNKLMLDKINIARDYLLPKLFKQIGLTDITINFSDQILEYIIDTYTNEGG
ncbi:MAG: hypothetical protein WCJ59_03215, partial [bacterium]